MFSLEGKIAVVTGGASGIGRATVERFAKAGARLCVGDLNDASGLAKEVGGVFVKADVTKEEQVKALMEKAAETFGRIDVVINNAGGGAVSEHDFLTFLSTEDFDACYRLNLLGVVYGIKHSVEHMTRGGSILNTASVAGLQGAPRYSPYAAAKAGVVGVTRTAALELAARNIRVNCVCPSVVDTPLARRADVSGEFKLAPYLAPLGRVCKPEEVAAVFHFLASDEASLITGQAISIDGGMTAGLSMRLVAPLLETL
jgi:3alpha(or 20beta)-hydroxysteroid dehydrogenase